MIPARTNVLQQVIIYKSCHVIIYIPDCMSKAACSFGGQYIALAVVLADVRAARALGRLLRAWYVLLSSN